MAISEWMLCQNYFLFAGSFKAAIWHFHFQYGESQGLFPLQLVNLYFPPSFNCYWCQFLINSTFHSRCKMCKTQSKIWMWLWVTALLAPLMHATFIVCTKWNWFYVLQSWLVHQQLLVLGSSFSFHASVLYTSLVLSPCLSLASHQ